MSCEVVKVKVGNNWVSMPAEEFIKQLSQGVFSELYSPENGVLPNRLMDTALPKTNFYIDPSVDINTLIGKRYETEEGSMVIRSFIDGQVELEITRKGSNKATPYFMDVNRFFNYYGNQPATTKIITPIVPISQEWLKQRITDVKTKVLSTSAEGRLFDGFDTKRVSTVIHGGKTVDFTTPAMKVGTQTDEFLKGGLKRYLTGGKSAAKQAITELVNSKNLLTITADQIDSLVETVAAIKNQMDLQGLQLVDTDVVVYAAYQGGSMISGEIDFLVKSSRGYHSMDLKTTNEFAFNVATGEAEVKRLSQVNSWIDAQNFYRDGFLTAFGVPMANPYILNIKADYSIIGNGFAYTSDTPFQLGRIKELPVIEVGQKYNLGEHIFIPQTGEISSDAGSNVTGETEWDLDDFATGGFSETRVPQGMDEEAGIEMDMATFNTYLQRQSQEIAKKKGMLNSSIPTDISRYRDHGVVPYLFDQYERSMRNAIVAVMLGHAKKGGKLDVATLRSDVFNYLVWTMEKNARMVQKKLASGQLTSEDRNKIDTLETANRSILHVMGNFDFIGDKSYVPSSDAFKYLLTEEHDKIQKIANRDYVGYFRSALLQLSSMNFIQFNVQTTDLGLIEDIENLEVKDASGVDFDTRYQSDWAASIDPRSTATATTKVFLASVPKYTEKDGEIKKVMDSFGNEDTYEPAAIMSDMFADLAEMHSTPETFVDDINSLATERQRGYAYGIQKALERFRKESTDAKADMLIYGMGRTFSLMSATINLALINVDGYDSKGNIIDANRNNIRNKILMSWQESFKGKIEDLYDVTFQPDPVKGINIPTATVKTATRSITLKEPTGIKLPVVLADFTNDPRTTNTKAAIRSMDSYLQEVKQKALSNPSGQYYLPLNFKDNLLVVDKQTVALDMNDVSALIWANDLPANVTIWTNDDSFSKVHLNRWIINDDELGYSDNPSSKIDAILNAFYYAVTRWEGTEVNQVGSNNRKDERGYDPHIYQILHKYMSMFGVSAHEDLDKGWTALRDMNRVANKRPFVYNISYKNKARNLKTLLINNVIVPLRKLAYKEQDVTSEKTVSGNDDISDSNSIQGDPWIDVNRDIRDFASATKPFYGRFRSDVIRNINGMLQYIHTPAAHLYWQLQRLHREGSSVHAQVAGSVYGQEVLPGDVLRSYIDQGAYEYGLLNGAKSGPFFTIPDGKVTNASLPLMVWLAYQNNEGKTGISNQGGERRSRGLANYVFTYGDSQRIPMVSGVKHEIYADLMVDNNSTLYYTISETLPTGQPNPTFELMLRSFKADLRQMAISKNRFQELEAVAPEQRRAYAMERKYQNNIDFVINDDGSIRPGSGHSVFRFGNKVHANMQKYGIVDGRGLLVDSLQKQASSTELNDMAVRTIFKDVLFDFIQDSVNDAMEFHERLLDHFHGNKIEQMGVRQSRSSGEYIYEYGIVEDYGFFNSQFINSLQNIAQTHVNGAMPNSDHSRRGLKPFGPFTSYIQQGVMEIPASYITDKLKEKGIENAVLDFEKNPAVKEIVTEYALANGHMKQGNADRSPFLRYMMLDMVVNYHIFKSELDAIIGLLPQNLGKTNFNSMKIAYEKRGKMPIAPGYADVTITKNTKENSLYVIQVSDNRASKIKVRVDSIGDISPTVRKGLEYFTSGQFERELPERYKNAASLVMSKDANGNLLITERYPYLASLVWELGKEPKTRAIQIAKHVTALYNDGGSHITPYEYLHRLVRADRISNEDANRIYRALLEDTQQSFEQAQIDLSSSRAVGVLKYLYAGSMLNQGSDGNNQLQFVVIKDSELMLSKALVRGTENEKLLDDLQKLESQILGVDTTDPNATFDFRMPGLKLVSPSVMKLDGMFDTRVFDDSGRYLGGLTLDNVVELPASNQKSQIDNTVKKDLDIKTATQLQRNAGMDLTSNMRFGRNIFTERGHDLEGLTNEWTNSTDEYKQIFIDPKTGATKEYEVDFSDLEDESNVDDPSSGISPRGLAVIQFRLLQSIMYQKTMDLFVELGITPTANKGVYDYSFTGITRFLDKMRRQMTMSNGINLNNLNALTEATDEFLAPIEFLPEASAIKNRFMAMFSSIVKSVRTPGLAAVQISDQGFHKFDKKSGEIVADSSLKWRTPIEEYTQYYNSRAELEAAYSDRIIIPDSFEYGPVRENGNRLVRAKVIDYTLAEVDVTWFLRDKNGKLLDFDTYVDENGYPRLEKWDEEMLKMLAIRIPHTPKNSSIGVRIRKFIKPSYGNIIKVPPELTTVMGSDFDVDVLYTYYYNHIIDDAGRIVKLKSFMSTKQRGAIDAMSDAEMRDDYVRRMLTYFNGTYRESLETERLLRKEIRKQSRLIRKLDNMSDEAFVDMARRELNYMDALKEGETKKQAIKRIEKDLKRIIIRSQSAQEEISANTRDLEILHDFAKTQQDIEEAPAEVQEILEPYMGDASPLAAATEALQIANGELSRGISQLENMKTQLNSVLMVLDDELVESLREIKLSEAEERFETLEARLKEVTDSIKNAELAGANRYKPNDIFQIQSIAQLQNASLDFYMLTETAPQVAFESMRTLDTDIVNEMAYGERYTYEDDNGQTVTTSLAQGIHGSHFYSLTSPITNMRTRLANSLASTAIGIAANNQALSYMTQVFNLYIAGDTKHNRNTISRNPLFFTDSGELINEDAPTREDTNLPLNIPPNQLYQYTTPSYANKAPEQVFVHPEKGRYRLDRNRYIDSDGTEVRTADFDKSVLQSALDSVKEGSLPYANINPNTMGVMFMMNRLGLVKYVADFINQESIYDIQNYLQDIDGLYTGRQETSRTERMRTFVMNYMDRIVTDEVERADLQVRYDAELEKRNKDVENSFRYDQQQQAKIMNLFYVAIDLLSIPDEIMTPSKLRQGINTYMERLNTTKDNRDADYYKLQLLTASHYVAFSHWNFNLLSQQQKINTQSAGLETSFESNAVRLFDYQKMFKLMYRDTEGGNKALRYVGTVTDFGGIERLFPRKSLAFINGKNIRTFAANVFTPSINYGESLVHNLLSKPALQKFSIASGNIFNDLYWQLPYTIRSTSGAWSPTGEDMHKAMSHFTSYLSTAPELFKGFFAQRNPDGSFKVDQDGAIVYNDFEYSQFSKYGRDLIFMYSDEAYIGNRNITPDNEEINQVFRWTRSLAATFQALSESRDGSGNKGSDKFPILKYLTAKNERFFSSPSLLIYDNLNNFKREMNQQLVMTFEAMINSDDPMYRALGTQLLMYAIYSGNVNAPNSFNRLVPTQVLEQYGYYAALNNRLDQIRKNDRHRTKVLDEFIIQYAQHNPKSIRFKVKRNSEEYGVFDIESKDKSEPARISILPKGDNDVRIPDVVSVEEKNPETKKSRLRVFVRVGTNPIWEEVDVVGNNRWNFREYSYKNQRKPTQTHYLEQMAQGGRRFSMVRMNEAVRNKPDDYRQIMKTIGPENEAMALNRALTGYWKDEDRENAIPKQLDYATLLFYMQAHSDPSALGTGAKNIFVGETFAALQNMLNASPPSVATHDSYDDYLKLTGGQNVFGKFTPRMVYNHRTHTMHIFREGYPIDQRNSDKENARIVQMFKKDLSHEFVHAITVRALKMYYGLIPMPPGLAFSIPMKDAIRRMEIITGTLPALLKRNKEFNEFKENWNNIQSGGPINAEFMNEHQYFRALMLGEKISMKNASAEEKMEAVGEMLSYTWTEPEFSKLLNSISLDPKTPDGNRNLQVIKDTYPEYLKSMSSLELGEEQKPNTLLGQLISTISELLEWLFEMFSPRTDMEKVKKALKTGSERESSLKFRSALETILSDTLELDRFIRSSPNTEGNKSIRIDIPVKIRTTMPSTDEMILHDPTRPPVYKIGPDGEAVMEIGPDGEPQLATEDMRYYVTFGYSREARKNDNHFIFPLLKGRDEPWTLKDKATFIKEMKVMVSNLMQRFTPTLKEKQLEIFIKDNTKVQNIFAVSSGMPAELVELMNIQLRKLGLDNESSNGQVLYTKREGENGRLQTVVNTAGETIGDLATGAFTEYDELYAGVKNYNEFWPYEIKRSYHEMVLQQQIIC